MNQRPLYSELDAHSHLQTLPPDILPLFFKRGRRVICNGTSPSDWSSVLLLGKKYPDNLFPYCGIHPWQIGKISDDWIKKLRNIIEESGSGIGEIGLDKSYCSKREYEVQKDIFKEQLSLAAENGVPVSIHCVRAWGDLLRIVKCRSTVPRMIHSFNGSVEIMRELTGMGIYLSFSPAMLTEKGEKYKDLFRKTPLEYILIESDFSFGKGSSAYDQVSEYEQKMQYLYSVAGELKNCDADQIRKVVINNGKIFTDRTSYRQ